MPSIREEIIEIEQYCTEHRVSMKARQKYQREEEVIGSDPFTGKFIQLTTSPSGPAMQPSRRTGKKTTAKDADFSYLYI